MWDDAQTRQFPTDDLRAELQFFDSASTQGFVSLRPATVNEPAADSPMIPGCVTACACAGGSVKEPEVTTSAV